MGTIDTVLEEIMDPRASIINADGHKGAGAVCEVNGVVVAVFVWVLV